MIVAFDTSVIVAGLVAAHRDHDRAIVWLEAAAAGQLEAVVCCHAIAETWSVLTRLPLNPRLGGDEALRVVGRLRKFVRTVPLTDRSYDVALARCVEAGLRSGAVFDALHLAAAEEANASVLLTFNVRDFERLRGGAPVRVDLPPFPPSLRLDSAPR